ncbi:MAG: flagellar motor switch protein FliM [Geminicoccaceae bacterium]|nr:MAG: flagellar motor switch protein FliM [Geminicoccaceae bacterium]
MAGIDDVDPISGDETVDQDAMAAEWAAMAGGDDEDEDVAAPLADEDGDDALASSWAKMMSSETEAGNAPAASGSSEAQGRVLNQDEIDSLLGVADQAPNEAQDGLMALLNNNSIAYERLPMLEIVFDRLVRMLTTSLRNFTSENVDVAIENIASLRFGDYLNSVPLPAMIGVFRAVEWDNFGLITVDSAMIYSIVDVLLGGRRGTAPMRVEGRPYTTIEGNLVTRLISLLLHDFSLAFSPITSVRFDFERLETNPRFAAIARPGNAAVVFKLRVDMEERGGCLEVLLPYATLEPARDLLLQMFMGERFGRDSIWEGHLAREILATDVQLEAVLDQQVVALGDVLAFEVGTVLNLNATADSPVELRCGHVPMFTGHIGRTGDHLAIKVDHRKLDPEHDDA